MTARERLASVFAPDVLAAFDAYVQGSVAEAVERALAEHGSRKWYTTAEAAERLGTTAAAIRMRVKRGRLTARRDQGRRLLVSAPEVEALAPRTYAASEPTNMPRRGCNRPGRGH